MELMLLAKIIAVFFLIFGIILIWNIKLILLANAPKNVACTVLGGRTAFSKNDFPKIIWTYWDAVPAPEIIEACQRNWRQQATGYEIRFLTKENFILWIKSTDLYPDFYALPPYRQADWLRLKLLSLYGGVWMDATIILNSNFNWLEQKMHATGVEVVAFYLDRFTCNKDIPVVENWFFAAIPKSPFIIDLLNAFEMALDLGEQNFLNSFGSDIERKRVTQNIPESDLAYLIMHVAALKILNLDISKYRIALLRAEDMAYSLHQALGWRKKHLYFRLAWLNERSTIPKILKIRGPDRRVFENFIAKKIYKKNSILVQLLDL